MTRRELPARAGLRLGTATYPGDADLDSSRSRPVAFSVTKASTKTALVLSRKKVAFDHEPAELLTATVSPEYRGPVPTGTVTVTESTTRICVITLSAATGSCSLSAEQLTAGSYKLVAAYSGDADFDASTSANKALTVTS